jgi:outer membrane protein
MKRILVLLIILVGISMASAQAVKIGYVNTDRILAGSNEAAEIARVYDLDRASWMNQIKTLNEDVKQMERNFEIDKLTKNEAAKRDAQAKIDAKKAEAGQKLEEYFGDNGKAEQRYKELIEPLTKKINDVIKKISEQDKYTLVLDVSMGTVLYASPSMDITDLVLAELNIDTQQPGQGNQNTTQQKPDTIQNQPVIPTDNTNQIIDKK